MYFHKNFVSVIWFNPLLISSPTWTHLIATAVFLWASYHHHITFRILASLRQEDKNANIIQDTKHKFQTSPKYQIPHGDWFSHVSCPNYLAEIILYGCLAVILGPYNASGLLLFLWVAINQTIMAVMYHAWYKEKFPEYPKERKAVLPWFLWAS